ncbi:two-component sensor histidine kinase [Lachnoclostridium sp. An196]|uniref:sensor histidine kinase n=1 Tax=Lachnoclostridium sp. An196 TaxID=1965583 RepID=UPI000B37D960|nr:HAMP domain-containing sensor histidine kinase [Lachnoclostridium sp. An196]OUP20248.1 two-component sensor histidine kinase [Lachnoclostridium sp. An196]
MLKMNVRKFLRSLNFRIMVFLILIGIIPALLVAGGFLAAYDRLSITQLGNDVRNQCQILATQLSSASYFENMDNQTLEGEMTQLATLYDGRIIIIDQDLKIVEDTYDLEDGKTIIAESVIRCFRGETVDYRHGGRFIELTVPITTGGEEDQTIIGVILVTASTDTQTANLETLRQSMETWLAAIGICILALAILLSGWLVKPLRHMNQSIGGLVEGALADDLDIHDCTETEKISDTFNLMLAKLRRIEESRQEFVSNVSHELKTPLASMKVLADSLLVQEGAPVELYQEFMKDIAEEIDRENTIISDLLTLVKMDRKAAEVNVAVTDINEFLEQILKRLRPIAEKEKVEVVFESNRSVSAEIDATKLSLAFTNLVENAIKYNKENGWVRVTLDADHKYFYVKVSDSGIGIPQESLDNIFERFYRCDKSHSREIGGTGLGLAITKNAVVAHGGAIKVQSVVGEGTTFTVRIPLRYIV